MTVQIFLILVFSFFNGSVDCNKMSQVRSYYGNIQSEKELNGFIRLLESFKCNLARPYEASATMQKAQFAFAPWTKYKYFLKGKKMLEDFIRENPDNVDGRYVRFLVQSHAPFFLGYNSNLQEDARVIRDNIDQQELSYAFKQQILNHLEILGKSNS